MKVGYKSDQTDDLRRKRRALTLSLSPCAYTKESLREDIVGHHLQQKGGEVSLGTNPTGTLIVDF